MEQISGLGAGGGFVAQKREREKKKTRTRKLYFTRIGERENSNTLFYKDWRERVRELKHFILQGLERERENSNTLFYKDWRGGNSNTLFYNDWRERE